MENSAPDNSENDDCHSKALRKKLSNKRNPPKKFNDRPYKQDMTNYIHKIWQASILVGILVQLFMHCIKNLLSSLFSMNDTIDKRLLISFIKLSFQCTEAAAIFITGIRFVRFIVFIHNFGWVPFSECCLLTIWCQNLLSNHCHWLSWHWDDGPADPEISNLRNSIFGTRSVVNWN